MSEATSGALIPSIEDLASTKPQLIETFDDLIAEKTGDVDAISAEFNLSRAEVVENIRQRYEKFKVFFPSVNWAINVYRSNLKYDASADIILAKYQKYDISRDTALKIAKCEDADRVCAKCSGKTCAKINQFQRHSVTIIDGEVRLNPKDICHFERERRLRRKIDRAKIPARYLGLTFDDYVVDADNKNAVGWVKYAIKNPNQSLYIFGAPGTGKTFLSAILAQEFMNSGKSVLFVDMPNLLDNLRKSFSKGVDNDSTLDEMMNALVSVDVLFIDDLGVEKPTEWAIERLYLIINDRYNAQKPMIVTSNLGLDVLINRFTDGVVGARIVSRLRQMCKLAEITGGDRRIGRRE